MFARWDRAHAVTTSSSVESFLICFSTPCSGAVAIPVSLRIQYPWRFLVGSLGSNTTSLLVPYKGYKRLHNLHVHQAYLRQCCWVSWDRTFSFICFSGSQFFACLAIPTSPGSDEEGFDPISKYTISLRWQSTQPRPFHSPPVASNRRAEHKATARDHSRRPLHNFSSIRPKSGNPSRVKVHTITLIVMAPCSLGELMNQWFGAVETSRPKVSMIGKLRSGRCRPRSIHF